MLSRRQALKAGAHLGAALMLPLHALGQEEAGQGVEVNDVQSRLNATRVHCVARPTSMEDLQAALREARRQGRGVSVAGGRHSMGGQQFGRDALLLDMRSFNRLVWVDRRNGLVEAEAGIEWPRLIEHLLREQAGDKEPWGIREKQTGVDRVTLGGSLASNVHGRGLRFPPIIGDVEAFNLLDADGKLHHCSRRENGELFGLAIGGYGLFGVITHVTLRLARRVKVQRAVEIVPIRDLLGWVQKRREQGYQFGDCQYSTDLGTAPAEHRGVFSCYKPVAGDTPIPDQQKQLAAGDWAELYRLARTDKKKAFERYSQYYQSTNGQVYWSDTHQLAGDFDGYREAVDAQRGTEMITEVYVRPDNFLPLLSKCRQDFLDHQVDMTYGTIRFIEKDAESFLPWAREASVCIVCNLHVKHTPQGKQKAADDFRRIIDRAIEHGGRYFLTYHRWATRQQIETCYPRFVDFLKLKKKYDPQERFQSDWYRHYREMFAERLR